MEPVDKDGVLGRPGVQGVSDGSVRGEPGEQAVVGVGVVDDVLETVVVVLWNEAAPRESVSERPLGFDRFKPNVGGSEGGDDVRRRLEKPGGMSSGGESPPASLTSWIEVSKAGVMVAALCGSISGSMPTTGDVGRIGTTRLSGGGRLRTLAEAGSSLKSKRDS